MNIFYLSVHLLTFWIYFTSKLKLRLLMRVSVSVIRTFVSGRLQVLLLSFSVHVLLQSRPITSVTLSSFLVCWSRQRVGRCAMSVGPRGAPQQEIAWRCHVPHSSPLTALSSTDVCPDWALYIKQQYERLAL